jgi:hypothetical protein
MTPGLPDIAIASDTRDSIRLVMRAPGASTLTLLALPWLLVLINPSWLLTAPGNIDPWIYFGFFGNLPDYLRVFGDTYYASRLAWIVPGALVHELMPPLAARYVLHVGVFYVALFAIHFTLRRTVGPRAALFASILIGCYTYFLRAMGWDYVDGAGIAYYAVALACLTAAIEARRRWLPLACAGGAFAGAFHSNVAWSMLLPALACYYAVTTRAAAGRVRSDWLPAAAGAALVTLLLGVVSVANSGQFWFFVPSIKHVLFLSEQTRTYETNPEVWLAAVRILAVPVLVFVAALGYRVARGARETTLGRLACDHYTIACVLVVAPDLAGRALLQNPLYLTYTLPGMALAIGVLFRDAIDRLSRAQFGGLVTIMLAALSVPLLPVPAFRMAPADLAPAIAVMVGVLVAATAAGLWLRRSPTWSSAITFAVCAGAVNMIMADPQLEFWDLRGREHRYRAIVAAADTIRAVDPDVTARFWYDEAAPLGHVFMSIASTRLFGYRLISTRFPSLRGQPSGADASIAAGQRLLLLTSDPAALNEANAALRTRQLAVIALAAHEFAEGDVRFSLLSLRVVLDRGPLAERPLPVSVGVFLDGSTRRAAARVAVDAGQDLIEITTNHSTYDFQIVSRPIAVMSGRRHVVEFDLQIPKGGAGVHVVGARTQAVLASHYWCNQMDAATPQGFTFEASRDDPDVYVALSNCGSPAPVVSEFSVRRLQIWPHR